MDEHSTLFSSTVNDEEKCQCFAYFSSITKKNRKGLAGTNTLAYFDQRLITKKNKFYKV